MRIKPWPLKIWDGMQPYEPFAALCVKFQAQPNTN